MTNNFQVPERKSVSIEQSPENPQSYSVEEASGILETRNIGGMGGQRLVRKDGSWALQRSESERIRLQAGS